MSQTVIHAGHHFLEMTRNFNLPEVKVE